MSYCVNCGVELADSEKRCPLCNVEVVNPIRPWSESAVRPYPAQLERIVSHIDHSFFAGLISVILLIPLSLTMLIDFFANSVLSWSVYVVGGILVFFTLLIFPFFFKKPNVYWLYAADFTVILLYLWVIDLTDPNATWFLTLGLPIVLAFALFLYGLTIAFRIRLYSFWTRSAAVLVCAGLYTVCVELAVNLFLGMSWIPHWSTFVLFPCVILAAALFILRGRKHLREELHRRLFM